MKEQFGTIKIQPLIKEISQGKNKLLVPSDNLLNIRTGLNKDIIIQSPIFSISINSLKPIGAEKLNEQYAIFNELYTVVERQELSFKAWAHKIVSDVDRTYERCINSKSDNGIKFKKSKQDIYDFLFLFINDVLIDEDITKIVNTFMINEKPSDYSRDFIEINDTNYRSSVLYNEPVEYFKRKMREKDMQILNPLREIWQELFKAHIYATNESFHVDPNKKKDHVKRQQLMERYFEPPDNPNEKVGKKQYITIAFNEFRKRMINEGIIDNVNTRDLYTKITTQTVANDWKAIKNR